MPLDYFQRFALEKLHENLQAENEAGQIFGICKTARDMLLTAAVEPTASSIEDMLYLYRQEQSTIRQLKVSVSALLLEVLEGRMLPSERVRIN